MKIVSEARSGTLQSNRAINKRCKTAYYKMDNTGSGKMRIIVHDLIRKLGIDPEGSRKLPTLGLTWDEVKKQQDEFPMMKTKTLMYVLKRVGFPYEMNEKCNGDWKSDLSTISQGTKHIRQFRQESRPIYHTDESNVRPCLHRNLCHWHKCHVSLQCM